MPPRGSLAVLCALSFGACSNEQPVDLLDPAELERLAGEGGDGRGEALTGVYLIAAEVLTCDCPQRMGVDLCGPEAVHAIGLDGPSTVVQVDGYLTFQPDAAALPFALSGAIDRDRAFLLAGISGVAIGLFAVAIHARFEGGFAADRTIAGELTHRLVGELPDGPVDCRTVFAIDGVAAPAPAIP